MRVTADWQQTVKSTVYYGLFCHFVEHITEFWMSFCTPASEDQEFILSDTGSHVYEGLTVDFQDEKTGESLDPGPRFHLFAPISPRLMIVLRSKHLPEPHEDKSPEIKTTRQLYRQTEIDSIYGPGTKSILEDLPVYKAVDSYSTLVNGVLRKRPDWDGQLCQTDTFSFPFFKISMHHGRVMNGLLLGHAFHGRTIIFNKKAAFFDLLEWFVTEPCDVGKRLGGEYHAEQMRYLTRLVALMHAKEQNISPSITNSPVINHLDIEGYKSQNNDATRWLKGLEKNHVGEEKVKKNREGGSDTKVYSGQPRSVDPLDRSKSENNSIKGQSIDYGLAVRHEEESRLQESKVSAQHASTRVQKTRPIEELSKMVGIILFLLAVTYAIAFLAQWSERLLQVWIGINWYELLVITVVLPYLVVCLFRWLDSLFSSILGIRLYHVGIILILLIACQADKLK